MISRVQLVIYWMKYLNLILQQTPIELEAIVEQRPLDHNADISIVGDSVDNSALINDNLFEIVSIN